MSHPEGEDELAGILASPDLATARHYLKRFGGTGYEEALQRDVHESRLSVPRAEALQALLAYVLVEAAVERAPDASFTAIRNAKEVQERSAHVFDAQQPADPEGLVGSLIGELQRDFSYVHFARAGRPVYEVSAGLAERLAVTELRGVTCDMMRLPHRALKVVVPREAGLEMSEEPIYEAYLAEEVDRLPGWAVLFQSATRSLFMRLPLPPGEPVEAGLGMLFQAGEGEVGWRQPFSWLMNVVLYAASDGVREEVWRNNEARQLKARLERAPAGGRRDEMRRKLRALDPRRVVVLGPGVARMEGGAAAGTPMLRRTLVQGHWKQQPHGPGNALRKMMWIQPYWRGPDELEPSTVPTHALK